MKRINGLSAAILAGAMLLGTSAFADWRPQNETWRDRDHEYSRSAFVRGVVQRVDYRRDLLVLRDDRTGAFLTIDMRATGRRGRIDADDLRRGDVVSLSGDWVRGTFVAWRVDSVRSGYGYRRW